MHGHIDARPKTKRPEPAGLGQRRRLRRHGSISEFNQQATTLFGPDFKAANPGQRNAFDPGLPVGGVF